MTYGNLVPRVVSFSNMAAAAILENEKTLGTRLDLLSPQGFRPEGEIPAGGTLVAPRILRKVLTVEMYRQYGWKNLDLLEHGPQGIGR